jgi:tetratricopeptide (TPR) repeat protein
MTPAEARQFIADVQAERGVKPDSTPVTGVDQVLTILQNDEIGRFENAARIVAGKPGIDAQAVYATIELSWSDGYSTIARIAEELGKRAQIEADRLRGMRESGRELVEAEAKALERAQQNIAFFAKARDALDVLAVDHLRSTVSLVNELLRQHPQDPRTYRIAAFYYLLSGDWQHYDTAVTWLKESEATDAGVQYLRALEAWKRNAMRQEADAFLKEALRLDPKMVRAQAKLVLTQESIDARYAELQALKTLAPSHPIVNIAGPAITDEYEVSAAIRKAQGQSPAAQP